MGNEERKDEAAPEAAPGDCKRNVSREKKDEDTSGTKRVLAANTNHYCTSTGGIDGDHDESGVKSIRMLEFFSGIGGMRLSLERALWLLNDGDNHDDNDDPAGSRSSYCDEMIVQSQPQPQPQTRRSHKRTTFRLDFCRAYDISLHANNVYRHNFEAGKGNGEKCNETNKNFAVATKLVEQLRVGTIAKLRTNLWTMSPPCQPFTTNGRDKKGSDRRLDAEDKRCNGLKGIISLLDALRRISITGNSHAADETEGANAIEDPLPRWILLENVKGFANSEMCRQWYECLNRNGYSYKPYLLSPIDLGIPNHRMRFYVLAERTTRSPRWYVVPQRQQPQHNHADVNDPDHGDQSTTVPVPIHDAASLPNRSSSWSGGQAGTTPPTIQTIGTYVFDDDFYAASCDEPGREQHAARDGSAEAASRPVVPMSVLSKPWAKNLGIVTKKDTITHCFTAGYGRIYHRSTGSLLWMGDDTERDDRPPLSEVPLDRSDMTAYEGKLRRFTPEELLRLFGFVEVDIDGGCGGDEGKSNPFEIPSGVVPSLEQRYKLIGNSISVRVVTELLCELLMDSQGNE
ncbi:unnamed protein product [Pseudo-nitzschia multistriata]|uniref:tRNA (cytosine(38)-C(5))-methyltransferase n=1 Tax=Pseudo-nitzschia multistriata TaxID=183589 RepID=A0A448YZC4_9STRA|nr:unnamed protein product [Pseudo-nitzschia multistriata]